MISSIETLIQRLRIPPYVCWFSLFSILGLVVVPASGLASHWGTRATILLKSLENENATVREDTVRSLWDIGDKLEGEKRNEAISSLRHLLHDKEKGVRYSAAVGLIKIDPTIKEAVPVLIEAVKDKGIYQLAAVSALGNMGSEARDAVPVLIAAMNEDQFNIASPYVDVLKAIGTSEALEAIKPLVHKQETRDRVNRIFFNPIPNILIALFFFILFWRSRALRKAGKNIVYRPLILPIALWSLYAVYGTPLIEKELIAADIFSMFPFFIVVTLAGVIPWSLSWLWLWWQERRDSRT